jgi:hypothetical protein
MTGAERHYRHCSVVATVVDSTNVVGEDADHGLSNLKQEANTASDRATGACNGLGQARHEAVVVGLVLLE